jgi:hypothetical protein
LCVIDERNPCKFPFSDAWAHVLRRVAPLSRGPESLTCRGLITNHPDLREHALFALRNILHNNPENQAVVDTFRVSR